MDPASRPAGERVGKRSLGSLPFRKVADLLSDLQAQHSAKARVGTCARFWNVLARDHAFARDHGPASLYAVMRLLLPSRDQSTYGVKEATLRSIMGKALGIEQKRLLVQHDKSSAKGQRTAEMCVLAALVERLVAERGPREASEGLTIALVTQCLDGLASAHASGVAAKDQREMRARIICELFHHRAPSPREAYWLTRIILKTEFGGERLEAVLINSLVDKAYEQLQCRGLKELCEEVVRMTQPGSAPATERWRAGVFHRTAQPGRICTPLHAWSNALRLNPAGELLLETKMDGWRLQLHVLLEGVRVFTHSGRESSTQLGAHSAYFAQVCEQLRRALPPTKRGHVLDCEVVVVGAGGIEPFGTVEQLAGKTADEQRGVRHHCLILFDVLMEDGETLTSLPLRERRERLEAMLTPVAGWVVLSEARRVRSPSSAAEPCPIRSAMADVIAQRLEGLVVKALDSPYPTHGGPASWWKLKPCYVGGMVDELLLLVLALNWGSGANVHRLSRLVLGARDGREPSSSVRFVRVCETGLGLSDKQLAELGAHFRRLEERGLTLSRAELERDGVPSWCAGKGPLPSLMLRHWSDGPLVDMLASEMLPLPASRKQGERRARRPCQSPHRREMRAQRRDEEDDSDGDGEGEGHADGEEHAEECADERGSVSVPFTTLRGRFCFRFPRIVRLRLDRLPMHSHCMEELRLFFCKAQLPSPSQHPLVREEALRQLERADADFRREKGCPLGSRLQPGAPSKSRDGSSDSQSESHSRQTAASASEHGGSDDADQPKDEGEGSHHKRARMGHGSNVHDPNGDLANALQPGSSPPLCARASQPGLGVSRAVKAALKTDACEWPLHDALRSRSWSGCTFLLDKFSIHAEQRAPLAAQLRCLGAQVVKWSKDHSKLAASSEQGLDPSVTHVLLNTHCGGKWTYLIRFVAYHLRRSCAKSHETREKASSMRAEPSLRASF